MELEGADALPDRRLPQGGGADPRDAGVGRAARARRQGEAAAGDRQDDRGQDRRGRRRRRDPRADEAQGRGAGRGRRLHAPARASARRPRAGSGRSSGSRPSPTLQGGRRGGAAARARRHRPGHGGEDRGGARAAAGGRGPAARAARDDAAEAARRRRGAARASGVASRSRSPARRGGCARPCATSTSSRPRPTRRRSSTTSARCRGSSTSPRRGRRRRRSSRTTGSRFDLRVVPPESYGNLLQHFTGSKHHNVALREDAVRRGFSISEYSVTGRRDGRGAPLRDRGGGLRASSATTWIPPELRENGGELAAARAAASCRSSSSSATCAATCTRTRRGRTARTRSRTMVAAAQRARLRLLRDLRPLAAAARRPAAAAVGADRRAQRASSRRSGSSRGSRSTSVPTATLDVSDEELATRDWVVASVALALRPRPDRAGARGDGEPVRRLHRPRRRTGRSASARRRPIDLERVIEKALETGTFLEINSQPDRLDLTDVHARAAREAGAEARRSTRTATRSAALDYVELGVGQARRAWLTKDDVLNTRTWKQIEKLQEEAVTLPRRPRTAPPTGSTRYLAARRRAAGRAAGRARRACARGCRRRRPSTPSRSRRSCATSTS